MNDATPTEEEFEEVRTAHHEAAHAVVAYKFRRPVRLVSIRPGEAFVGIVLPGKSVPLDASGFDPDLPGIAQPARFRRRIEADICVFLAGTIGEELAGWRPAYREEDTDERHAKKAALDYAGLSKADRDHLAALERNPTTMSYDEENADELSWVLAGGEAAQLLNLLRATTRRIVWAHRDAIGALAAELLEHKVITGRRVRETLKEKGVQRWH